MQEIDPEDGSSYLKQEQMVIELYMKFDLILLNKTAEKIFTICNIYNSETEGTRGGAR